MCVLRNAWAISRYTVPGTEFSDGRFPNFQNLFNKLVEADQEMSRK
jgi:hypothetical protein